MASILSSPLKPLQTNLLDVPDDDFQRGRKRRRSSGNTPPIKTPSTGSSTLRGRPRRRSLSKTFSPSQALPSQSISSDDKRKELRTRLPKGKRSPKWKYQKKNEANLMVPDTKRRRSQSPSRSRSGADGTPKPRRRQRTSSRSRRHELERAKEVGSEKGESAIEDE